MSLLSIPGLATTYYPTSQTTGLWKALLTPVTAVQQRLRHAMTGHYPDTSVDYSLLRQSHSFTMLVESDIKEAVSGLLH
jgi:hypothetical protein